MVSSLRTWVGVAVVVGACGFDSSGNGHGGAELGESADSDAGDGPTGEGGATTSTGAATDAGSTGITGTMTTTTTTTVGTDDGSDSSSGGTDTGEPVQWGPFLGAFAIVELNSDDLDDDPTLRGDLLEIYFASDRDGTEDIWVSVRTDVAQNFPAPQLVAGDVNDDFSTETTPELSPDGRVLTFASDRGDGTSGLLDIFVTTRADPGDAWAPVVRISELSTASHEGSFVRTQDELTGYLCRNATGNQEDLLRTTRLDPGQPWGAGQLLAIDADASDCSPWIDAKDQQLWFTSERDGGQGGYDLWWSTVDNGVVAAPQAVVELNTDDDEEDPWMSPDGSILVFASDRAGSTDLYFAVRAPL